MTQEQVLAYNARMLAIQVEIEGMKAENIRVYPRIIYGIGAFTPKVDKLHALADELAEKPKPEHTEPLYKVGTVVQRIDDVFEPFCITRIEWNEHYEGWFFKGNVTPGFGKGLLKLYTPTFAVGDMVQVLDIPVRTIAPQKDINIMFTEDMALLIGGKFKIINITEDMILLNKTYRNWHPSWLLKVEPERTIEVNQWWGLPDTGIYRIDKISANEPAIHFTHIGWINTNCVLAVKQYRVEEL